MEQPNGSTTPTPRGIGRRDLDMKIRIAASSEISKMWSAYLERTPGRAKRIFPSGSPRILGPFKAKEFLARWDTTLSVTGQPWIVITSYDHVTSPGITTTTYILPVVSYSGWLTRSLAKMGIRIRGSLRYSFLTYTYSQPTNGDSNDLPKKEKDA